MSKRLLTRKWRLFGMTVVALVAFAIVFAAGSSANLSGSTFESTDGNLVVNGGAGAEDWANAPGFAANIDVASGSSDNSFGQGTSEDNPDVTIVDGSIPPNKNDLTRAYLGSESVGGQNFLYLAWERAVNTGDANLDFELDQNPTPGWDSSTTGAVTINRTEGDLLFTYDFSGSGTPTLGLNFWLTAAAGHNASECLKSNKLPCWGNHVTLSPSGTPSADGAVNDADVTDNVTSPAVGTLSAGLFGEAALNLTAIPGIFSANTCKAFGSWFVKSRSSGESIDAELKDFIAPGPIHVSNCGSIELKKHWVGTAGNATLNIGTSAGGNQVDTATANGADNTTGANEVENGTYYVSETGVDSSLYTSSLACTDNGQPVTPGANNSLSVTATHQVVCTFTNTRNTGSIELKKHWVGSAGNATLNIGTTAGGNQVDTATANGADNTTGANTVDTGTYFVSESGVDSSLYSSALSCTDNGQAVTPGANSSVTVGSGHTVVCTYTNTRNTGSIELKKHWVGSAGNATLNIGTTAGGSQVDTATANGADNTTGANTVVTGTYFVSESGVDSSLYASTLACTDNGQAVTPGANSSVTVGTGHTVVCTFTNTRRTGSIELEKVWLGTKGNVTLKIGTAAGGSQVASQSLVAANGTTGAKTVDTGTYYVSESFDSPTNAADYTTSLLCTDNGTPVSPGTDSSLAVGDGHTVVCTFTNARESGTIELKKHWVGDAGNVTLKIGTAAGGSQVASQALVGVDGTTGPKAVDTGTYFVSEAFDSPTNASDYATTLACTDNGQAVEPGANNSLAVGNGHAVVCTFTNSRLPQVKVVKKLQPSDDPGTFDFSIDQLSLDNGGKGYGDGQDTGFVTVPVGAPVVSETGHGDTDLSDYDASVSCDNGDSADDSSVDLRSLTYGDKVTCTFTNVRHGTIEIVKHALGGSGTFNFTLTQQGEEGSTQFQLSPTASADDSVDYDVSPGDFTVVEAATDGWALTGLSCTTGGTPQQATPAQANIHIGPGDFVQCTYTNTKLATLIVKKVVDNSNGGGSKTPADFTITVAGVGSGPGSSTGTTYSGLMPGTYTVSESSVSGYSLTKTEGCAANGSITLAAGQTATCTLTNTSAAPPPPPPPPPPAPKVDLQITKSASPNPVTTGNQVTWSMVVTNNGPNNATGVTLADPVPAGMTFVSVATSQGTCTGGTLVSCQLGNLNVGASVTITLVTTANTTGTITNTGTTVAAEQETNTANNSASASVTVNGPFVPPVVFCTAVAVSPKQLTVGRANTLTLRVSSHGKAKAGVKVRVKGSTIRLTTKPSNGKGVIKQTVKPMKAGIVVFTPVAAKTCPSPRVGVIGVFTPPVTG